VCDFGLVFLSLATGIINYLAAAPDIVTLLFSIFSFILSSARLVFDFCVWCRGDGSADNGGASESEDET
jgi:heme A synthase